MSQRRILVIGSQCEALQHLKFLPVAAQDLYAVMTNPERGACVSALDGEGLLIDPVVNDVKDAIRTATLFIAYIGHGEHVRQRYYLLPADAQIPPTADTAVHLTNFIVETHDTAAGQWTLGCARRCMLRKRSRVLTNCHETEITPEVQALFYRARTCSSHNAGSDRV